MTPTEIAGQVIKEHCSDYPDTIKNHLTGVIDDAINRYMNHYEDQERLKRMSWINSFRKKDDEKQLNFLKR